MINSSFIQTDVSLAVDTVGPASGFTVLFLPTGGEARTVWRPIALQVATMGFRAVMPDYRGHGDSGRSDSYRLDDLCRDTLAVAQQRTDRPLVIVGGSIGGVVALLVAGEYKLPTRGIVLVDVGISQRIAAGRQEQKKIAAAAATDHPAIANLDPAILDGSLVRDVLSQQGRIRKAAGAIEARVRLVRGLKSQVVGETELQEFSETFPTGDTVDIPDAGHLVARDQPRRLAETIIDFLRSGGVS